MFERETFFGNNFNDWFRQLKLVLRVEKKMFIIEQPLPAAPAADLAANVLVEWNAIYDAYNEVACLILGSRTPELHRQFENSSPYDMIKELKSMFKKQATVESNGIYEIDLHDLVPNVNSIYNVSTKRAKPNLDSTYLWHCRLAHISKMTRKSFPHRSERATGLLGIIHTNVCGPLRHVSGQGASYFITFTYDYSRYGYVHLLKHKHTVFETFKDYALEFATYMVPTKKVDKTPYELWYVKVLNLSYLKVWGCEVLVKQDMPDKLQQKSIKCIFIGYPKETMGYYFYFPPKNKIVIARCAEFFEKNLITQEVSGWAIDLEEIQDEDTSPFEITSKIPMEVKGFEPPQEEVILIRRSERTHQAPNRLCINVKVDEHSLGDLNEPTSYKAAMLDLESNNCKTVGSKWIFKKKTDMDSIVHTYKAHIVAKGYTQLYGVDYEETFSPVTDIRAIRILISIAAFYDYEIWQTDVKTAFLDGYLDEDIYMQSTTAMSAIEAEYIAASEAAIEAVWIKKFISGLGIVPTINKPIKMFGNYSAALYFANEPRVQRGARHYHMRYHYVRESIALGEIRFLKVHTDDNLSDPFTNALSKGKLTQHARSMELRLASSFM
nr:hypothetical protein [Tanacetum cinerariifolium]